MTDSRSEDAKPSPPPAPPSIREARRGEPPPDSSVEMQRRLVELEKRLQEEKEKVLLSNLRSQEEAVYASKVETAIKDVQDKLRRDRRDAEQEENRLKLEAKVRELESRLVQERETWVATLQEQLKAREGQDKEVETHFIGRIEEMERRWLEEKAHWQKLVMGKDEEIRNLKIQSERLKALEIDAEKLTQEKRFLEEKAQQGSALAGQVQSLNDRLRAAESDAQRLAQEKRFLEEKVQSLGPLQSRLQVLEDKERELFQVRSELALAKEQSQTVRTGAREREERLLSENERLHHEVQSVVGRMRVETEAEVRRYKSELAMASASVQKLRAVAGTLERQRQAIKAQFEQLLKYKKGLEQGHDRAKAELLMMQRKWQENEQRIRQEAEVATRERVKDEVRRELIDEWHQQEDALRKQADEAQTSLGQKFEARIQALHEQAESLEGKLKAKTEESVGLQEKVSQIEIAKGQIDAEMSVLQEEYLRLKSRWDEAEVVKRAELDALVARHESAEKAWVEERTKNEEHWKDEQDRAEKAIDQARKSLNEAREQAGEQQEQISRLEARLADEQKLVEEARRAQGDMDQIRIEEKDKATAGFAEIRHSLDEARSEANSRKGELDRMQGELERLKTQLAEEKDRLEQSQKVRKESEFTWTAEKVEFEKKVAQLKEQLENFAEVSRMNMEDARRELASRVAVLEDEIEEYRRPKPNLFQKVLGAKPKPPKPPKTELPPSPPALPPPAPEEPPADPA